MKSCDNDLDAVDCSGFIGKDNQVYEKKESLANTIKIPNRPGLRYSVITFILYHKKMFSDECVRIEMRARKCIKCAKLTRLHQEFIIFNGSIFLYSTKCQVSTIM